MARKKKSFQWLWAVLLIAAIVLGTQLLGIGREPWDAPAQVSISSRSSGITWITFTGTSPCSDSLLESGNVGAEMRLGDCTVYCGSEKLKDYSMYPNGIKAKITASLKSQCVTWNGNDYVVQLKVIESTDNAATLPFNAWDAIYGATASGMCNTGVTCYKCTSDCATCWAKQCAACGIGDCAEYTYDSPNACSGDIPDFPVTCGDGTCEGNEDCLNCWTDCGKCPDGHSCTSASQCQGGYCCNNVCQSTQCPSTPSCDNDGVCEPGETAGCADCYTPSCAGAGESCTTLSCCSGLQCCSDHICKTVCTSPCKAVGTSCSTGTDCCSSNCIDGICYSEGKSKLTCHYIENGECEHGEYITTSCSDRGMYSSSSACEAALETPTEIGQCIDWLQTYNPTTSACDWNENAYLALIVFMFILLLVYFLRRNNNSGGNATLQMPAL